MSDVAGSSKDKLSRIREDYSDGSFLKAYAHYFRQWAAGAPPRALTPGYAQSLAGALEEVAELLAYSADEPPGELPPLPKNDHAFFDPEDEQPDILVWNEKSMRAYATAAISKAALTRAAQPISLAELTENAMRVMEPQPSPPPPAEQQPSAFAGASMQVLEWPELEPEADQWPEAIAGTLRTCVDLIDGHDIEPKHLRISLQTILDEWPALTKSPAPEWKGDMLDYLKQKMAAPLNQCDGCQRGLPVNENGHHEEANGRVDMVCTASRYSGSGE